MTTTELARSTGAQIIRPAEAEIHYGMPAEQYHSDADGPRISSSLAKLICQKSPFHAWAAAPGLGNTPYIYKPGEDDGTLVHSLILEPESTAIHEMVAKHPTTGEIVTDLRTNNAKAEYDEACARGQIPVLSRKLAAYRYKAEALRQRFKSHATRPIEFTGNSEVVIYWTVQTAEGPIRARCRLDHLRAENGLMIITDLKSAESAAPQDLRSACWRYGYDIQAAAYTQAVAAKFPQYTGRIVFEFAFLELERPFAVTPAVLTGKFARMGERRWARACEQWALGLKLDQWPSYNEARISPPPWAEAEEMGDVDE